MKPQYQHLKLIIECPTPEAYNVITKFFDIELDPWRPLREVRIGKSDYYKGSENLVSYIQGYYPDFTYLTYDQFVQQYLKPEPMEKNQLDLNKLHEKERAYMLTIYEANRAFLCSNAERVFYK